jgi:hypothetical protein
MGKNHIEALLVMIDRVTMHPYLQKLKPRGSVIVSDAFIKRL